MRKPADVNMGTVVTYHMEDCNSAANVKVRRIRQ